MGILRSDKVRNLNWGLKMKTEYIFPVLLILLDIGAAIVYGAAGDWKKTIYWIAAAVLNAAVTF